MLDTAEYPARLRDFLGLIRWRLRRDVTREVAVAQAVPPAAVIPPQIVLPAAGMPPVAPPTSLAHKEVEAWATPLAIDDHQVWACDTLTLLVMPGYGSWWLPALSQREGDMHLFRSREEDDMLHAVLLAAGLDALSAHVRRIDSHFAAGDILSNRLPPRREDLLSLPSPWVLCGAIARRQAEMLATDAAILLPLAHPLLLLTEPQQKRGAWQQILAYKQGLHD